jgi:hypothetical protein
VFPDGGGSIKPDGAFRVPVVFDNLIAQGRLPVTLGVFLNPGSYAPLIPGAAARSNRSFEYDSLGDRYARFLTEEFLPEVLRGLNVSSNPEHRAVAGVSSSYGKPCERGCAEIGQVHVQCEVQGWPAVSVLGAAQKLDKTRGGVRKDHPTRCRTAGEEKTAPDK